MNRLDFLKAYIPNSILRFVLYILFAPIVLGIIFAVTPFVIGGLVIYLAYKNISDEKIKWTVITIVTVSLIVSTSLFTKNIQENSNSNNNVPTNLESKNNNFPESENKETTFQGNQTQNNTQEQPQETFLVTRVVDGDTIEIEGGKRVRYIGIDTPETVDPNRPTGCYGKEASNKNSELVLNKKVRLVKDVSDTDRYGRLLRYVYIDNTFVNDYLVKEGYAKASTYAPDVKFSEQFAASEREARENKRGLWGSACELSIAPTVTPSTIAPAPTVAPSPVVQYNSTYSGGTSNSGSGVVKKSSTGICHAPGTTYYNKTKNFTSYETVEDCLNSGGRLPKK